MKRKIPNWPWIVFMFYNRVHNLRKEVIAHYPNKTIELNVWKSIGDEILLYHEIQDESDIEKVIHSAVMIKHGLDVALDGAIRMAEELHNVDNSSQSVMRRTKSAIWTISATETGPSSTLDFQQHQSGNIVCKIDGRLDYIGPDVDFGFRISGKSEANKIVVSDDVLQAFRCAKLSGIEPLSRYSASTMEGVPLKGITDGATLHFLHEE